MKHGDITGHKDPHFQKRSGAQKRTVLERRRRSKQFGVLRPGNHYGYLWAKKKKKSNNNNNKERKKERKENERRRRVSK